MHAQRDSREGHSSSWGGQPGLIYQRAFNYCAAEAARVDGITLLLASTPFHARELARRLPGKTLIHPPSSWFRNKQALEMIRRGELARSSTRFQPNPHGAGGSRAEVVIWAVPEKGSWLTHLDLVNQLKDRPGLFVILGETRRRGGQYAGVGGGRGARFFEPMGCIKTLSSQLQRAGWFVSRPVGFQGLSSLFWGALGRLPARLGRDDLLDRCVAAAGRSLMVSGRMAQWSTLWLVVAGSQWSTRD